MSKISFLQIKPGILPININSIDELTLKLANNKIVHDDIIDQIEDYIEEKLEYDPINYINSYFSKINNSSTEEKQYSIMSYDKKIMDSGTEIYHLIIYNDIINSTYKLNNMDNEIMKKLFNLLASNLIKFYSNSSVLFGDVFIISIDASYYDALLKLSDTTNDDKIKKIENKLNYSKVYYNFISYDLIKSYINVNYVTIYEKKSNRLIIYNRDIINNLIQSNTDIEYLNNNIIKIILDNSEIYIKTDNFLPGSHNCVMDKIDKMSNNNIYIINVSKDDILNLR
jgi:hypothetical protein